MKFKTVIGVVLIVFSFSAIVAWECVGRVRLTTSEVLVASRDIAAGSVLSSTDFTSSRIEKGSLLEGVLGPQSAGALEGSVAYTDMAAGQQVLVSYAGPERRLTDGQSYYVLPPEWICSKSSLTVAGDDCSFYLMPDKQLLGSYKAAIVGEGVEIVCRPEDYFRMYDEISLNEGSSILIVIDSPEWRTPHEQDN